MPAAPECDADNESEASLKVQALALPTSFVMAGLARLLVLPGML